MATAIKEVRKSQHARWLEKNKHKFGSHDGLPGEFHRKVLFDQIKPQSRVAIVTSHGSILSGRVVMRSCLGGWVLNLGGPHGTPGLADSRNVVFVQGATL